MKRKLLFLTVAMLSSSPLMAEGSWIKPSATSLGGDDAWVTFDTGFSAELYNPDRQGAALEQIKAYAPDGSEAAIENGLRGHNRTTFDLHTTQQGTWRVAIVSENVSGSYKIGDQPYRVGGRGGGPRPGGQGGPGGAGGPPRGEGGGERGGERGGGERGGEGQGQGQSGPAPISVPATPDFTAPEGATDVKLTLTGSRNETFVTLGSPSAIPLTNKGLEMQPITQPADLVSDEPGKFRFLVDGKPVAGLEVEAVADGRRYRDADDPITATTDANGEATIAWTGPGLYWVHADFRDETSPRPGISGRRFQYVANLEVAAP